MLTAMLNDDDKFDAVLEVAAQKPTVVASAPITSVVPSTPNGAAPAPRQAQKQRPKGQVKQALLLVLKAWPKSIESVRETLHQDRGWT